MTIILPYIFALYPLVLVIVALAFLLGAKSRNRLDRAMSTAISGSILAFAYLVGPWALTSYYLRYALPALFLIVTPYVFKSNSLKASAASQRSWFCRIFLSLTLLLVVVANILAIAAFHQPEKPIRLIFPVTSGKYYVLQGGNSVVSNPFHALAGNRLAFDFVKLNRFGNRSDGVFPGALDSYEIFGEKLYSPCTGTVVSLQNGFADNAPGHPDEKHPAGNHMVLRCGDAEVFLAHLKRDSIRVRVGEVVSRGQWLADIGNSGNTLEPHLHISATVGGVEKPVVFDEQNLSVNSIVNR